MDQDSLVEITAHIVAAYLEKNSVPVDGLGQLIENVSRSVASLGTAVAAPQPERPAPPVNPKRSVTADYLISLEDGKRYKTLKRHLSTRGLTPEQYREKWGLPANYPMVAPNYSASRSQFAKAANLGKKAPAKRKPGRPSKKAS